MPNLPVITLNQSDYEETFAGKEHARASHASKAFTPRYVEDMIAKACEELRLDHYDPIIEMIKLSLLSPDDRIRFACHSFIGNKLYPKPREIEDNSNEVKELDRRRLQILEKFLSKTG